MNTEKNSNIDSKNKLTERLYQLFAEEREREANKLSIRKYSSGKRTNTIAQNLSHYRKANKITQEKLAELMHVDRSTIINWESGTTVPDALQIEDLAKIFGVEINELHTKNVWFYSDSTAERRKNLQYEQDWLKSNAILPGIKLAEGFNNFSINNFARDYVWIGTNDYIIIALELMHRGFNVRSLHEINTKRSDCSIMDYIEDGLPGNNCILEVYLEKSQIKPFEEAVSEIIIDFASYTSKFDDIIDLRKKSILEEKSAYDIYYDYIEAIFDNAERMIDVAGLNYSIIADYEDGTCEYLFMPLTDFIKDRGKTVKSFEATEPITENMIHYRDGELRW